MLKWARPVEQITYKQAGILWKQLKKKTRSQRTNLAAGEKAAEQKHWINPSTKLPDNQTT